MFRTLPLRSIPAVAVLTAFLASSATQATTIVTFDELGLDGGDPVTTEYAAFGITVSNGQQFIETNPGFDLTGIISNLAGPPAPMNIHLTSPASVVSVLWTLPAGTALFINAFDALGVLQDSFMQLATASPPLRQETLFLQKRLTSAGITRVEVSFGVGIARLTFLPEPGMGGLLGLGALMVGWRGRRRG